MNVKSTELASSLLPYIAGLFDLGGCVKIETPNKGQSASLYVWVTCKNFKVMETLQTFGAYVGKRQDGQYRAKWRDSRAYGVLKSLMPHLIIRKDQAQIGIEFIEEKRRNPTPETDIVYRLRLKLLKQDDGEGGV